MSSNGDALKRGLRAVTLTATLGRATTVVGQIVLGALLLPGDFGIFAIVAGLAAAARILRDGGVRDVAATLPDRAWEQQRRGLFRRAAGTNVVLALAIGASAQPLADWYGHGVMAPMLVFVAVQLVLEAPWAITSGVLRRQGRFGTVGALDALALALQNVVTIIAAVLGAGTMSFVIGFPVAGLVRGLGGLWAMRERPWAWPTGTGEDRRGASSWWLVVAAGGMAMVARSDYLVLGALETEAVLGVYFFAYQLVNQVFDILPQTVQTVLLPGLAEADDTHQQRTQRAVTASVLIAGMGAVAVAAVLPLADALIWGDQWQGAFAPAFVFAAAHPLLTAYIALRMTLIAQSHLRRWAITSVAMAAGVAVAAGLGSRASDDPAILAVAVGGWLAIAGLATFWRAARTWDRPGAVAELVRAWFPGAAVAAGGCWLAMTTPELTDMAWLSAPILALWLARLMARRTVEDALLVLPGRLRAGARVVLGLPRSGLGREQDPQADVIGR